MWSWRTVSGGRRNHRNMLKSTLRDGLLQLFPKPGNGSIHYCLEVGKWFHMEQVYLDNKSICSLWEVYHKTPVLDSLHFPFQIYFLPSSHCSMFWKTDPYRLLQWTSMAPTELPVGMVKKVPIGCQSVGEEWSEDLFGFVFFFALAPFLPYHLILLPAGNFPRAGAISLEVPSTCLFWPEV